MRDTVFRFANFFYEHWFSLYRVAYFSYKRVGDRERIDRIKKVVKPGMTVVDIGANIGFYTVLLSRIVGVKGRVYSFEPDPLNFKRLQAVTRGLENVVLERSAVASNSGQLMLFRSGKYNVDHRTYDCQESREAITVSSWALDDYFPEATKIDFIKMDVQGFEFQALSGMKKIVQASERLVLLSEFWPYGLHLAGVRPSSYLELIRDFGLTVEESGNKALTQFDDKINDPTFYVDFFATRNICS